MFRLTIFTVFASTIFALQSCQDVINLDLSNSSPEIVIDGSISNFMDSVKVKVTMTTDYYTPTAITPVTDAEVSISDDAGNLYQLTGKPDGTYFITSLAGIPERTYTLKVKTTDNQYTATSKMPDLVPLDSLSLEYSINDYGEHVPEAILCYIKDPGGIANYYRVKVFKNDTLYSPDNGYSIYNDKYFDGNTTNLRIRLSRIGITHINHFDKFIVQVIGIEQSAYEYFNVLREIIDQGGILSVSTPANPPSNLNNDALGYFGAWSISQKMMMFH